MTSIYIKDFTHYTDTAIYEYLFTQNETEFEIIIPREFDSINCDDYAIVHEYLSAAYAGQRLAEISDRFSYFVPSTMNTTSFRFEVSVPIMEMMAETLHFILQGHYGVSGGDPFLVFHQLAADFLNDTFEETVKCHTWGLLHIANQYLD